ncbi:hypothetical protein HDA40_002133 [Hamadaea flava]|uniref:Uncharacterized protein n=1 Tax=Hamadaea flava TaxID=1742688 RepID=A0ABV8LJN1_9ACTN|nr:hypothetical protein [Hamadaea flava]MCP2323626.1 hypothetical protein [Hamadaea flava]
MLTFFDLRSTIDLATDALHRDNNHAALSWQLIGLPTLSAHPADPDAAPVMVLDERWLTSRWPHMTASEALADPRLHPHFTYELLPLAGDGEQHTALQAGLADGWTLLAADIDDRQISWYLARSRRQSTPKKLLSAHARTPHHPVLGALAQWQFSFVNGPPGLDHWIAHRFGPRYDVTVILTRTETRISAESYDDTRQQLLLTLPTGSSPEIFAAVAAGLAHLPAAEPSPDPSA